jgi:hypothetical protein
MHERYFQRVHCEQVVLDIGHDIGALIIYTNEELRGREIEVSLKGNDGQRTHTDVLERRIGEQPVFAAVFPRLSAGDYNIWRDVLQPFDNTTIIGGQVAEVDWRKLKS